MSMDREFRFTGGGFGYFWLMLWTMILTVVTCGLFYPWACSYTQRWICAHTFVQGRQLEFIGTGFGFFFQWLLIMLFTAITFGLYAPWGYCRLKRWKIENMRFKERSKE